MGGRQVCLGRRFHCGRAALVRSINGVGQRRSQRVNLCVADNPNAAIITAPRQAKCVWVDGDPAGIIGTIDTDSHDLPVIRDGNAFIAEITRRVGSQAHQESQRRTSHTRQRPTAAPPTTRKTRRAAAPSTNGDAAHRPRKKRTNDADDGRRSTPRTNGAATRSCRAAGPPPSRWRPSSATSRVSEFFAKNRHLLGFDNPRKALLTTVKEAVDNSLDACEEAGILPEIWVHIEATGNDRFKVGVQDNGPGILKKQIPLIFGKLLYGSKFHRLRQSRGQQGIGISAAGMYGVQTTGKPVKIISKVGANKPAHYYEIQIDTKKNEPQILNGRGEGVDIPPGKKGAEAIAKHGIEWVDQPHGTRVTIELQAKFVRGRGSVDEYLEQTAIANPHVTLHYIDPDGNTRDYPRSADKLPPEPKEIKPHPYGVELGRLITLLHECAEFDRRAVPDDDVFARHVARRPQDLQDGEDFHAREHAPHRPQGSRLAVSGDSGDADRRRRRPIAFRRSARS